MSPLSLLCPRTKFTDRAQTELLEAGFDPTTIHRRLKVGRSSIYRMKRCLQQHGTPYMPTELNKKNGRPKVLSAEQELVCLPSNATIHP